MLEGFPEDSFRKQYLDERSLSDLQSVSCVYDDAVVVFEPTRMGNVIVACSPGFQGLTHYSEEDLLLRPPEALLEGVPPTAVSRSAWKDFAEYCYSSRGADIGWMGESSIVHPIGRKDGSVFISLMTLGYCVVQGHPYVAAMHTWLAEGPFVRRLSQSRIDTSGESNRDALARLRQGLRSSHGFARHLAGGVPAPPNGGISFFTERLQDRTIVFSGGASAARREPEELPVGCMLFGSGPLKPHAQEGLGYALRVDGLAQTFNGLPLVGFTRSRPVNQPGSYPTVAKCLAQSVLVGGNGEAFARRQEHHFKPGFGKIPPTEVASWSLQPEDPARAREMLAGVKVGDRIECRYTCDGRIQFWLNDDVLLDFDVGCPPEADIPYWPVVDICNSVAAMTLLGPCHTASDHVAMGKKHPDDVSPILEKERAQGWRSEASTLTEDDSDWPDDTGASTLGWRSEASTLTGAHEGETASLGLDSNEDDEVPFVPSVPAKAGMIQQTARAACSMGILGLALAVRGLRTPWTRPGWL